MSRIAHVVAGLDAAAGGPSYSVPRLCRGLADLGAEVELLSVRGADPWDANSTGGDYRERRFTKSGAHLPIVRNLVWSAGLSRALRDTASAVDVIHDHGLWLMPNVQCGWAASSSKRPLVVSPRGMLAPAALAFSRRKKQAFWHLLQGRAIKDTACFHATSHQEYEEIRGFGLRGPVAIVPNGVDVPAPADPVAVTARSGTRTVLSLGRIHPKKGLMDLVRAWCDIECRHSDWRLRIVGPAENGHDRELRTLAESLGLARISIEAPIHGERKTTAYRDADIFVLPSLNENFGITVAEALAAGTPVITTKGTPWAGLDAEGCGWWIEHGADPLAAALNRAMEMPSEALAAMGAKGRAWVAREFSWQRVASDMLEVYRWLIGRTAMPATIRTG